MSGRPPLSIVIPAREGPEEVAPVLDALEPQVTGTGAEVVVVGGDPVPDLPSWVRQIAVGDDRDIYRLRFRGATEAEGEIVAIGEDHAVPRPDWCEAVIRAHAEYPDAPAVVGVLSNATDETAVGRANFFAFAAPWGHPPQPPDPDRAPPCSTLSFKREALSGISAVGQLEAGVIPALSSSGQIEPDDRVVVDHYQDHGLLWSITNAFHSSRSTLGFARPWMSWKDRRRLLRAIPRRVLLVSIRDARRVPGIRGLDLAIVVTLAIANTVGCVVGLLAGRGRSPELVA